MEVTIVGGVSVLVILSFVVYFIVKYHCEKSTKDYFNANIKDKLTSMFNPYEKQIIEHLEDMILIDEFKKSKVLLLNDVKNVIHNISFFSSFRNFETDKNDVELKGLNIDDFSMVILYTNDEFFEDEDRVEKYEKFLKSANNSVAILIYYAKGYKVEINSLTREEQLSTPINSQFTLIEKMHTAYLVKKVMKKKKS